MNERRIRARVCRSAKLNLLRTRAGNFNARYGYAWAQAQTRELISMHFAKKFDAQEIYQ
jgi:hypothetical protein